MTARSLRLTLKASTEFFACNLNRDDAIEARVSRLEHFSHATGADLRENFIGAEFVACGKGHLRDLHYLTRSESTKVMCYAPSCPALLVYAKYDRLLGTHVQPSTYARDVDSGVTRRARPVRTRIGR